MKTLLVLLALASPQTLSIGETVTVEGTDLTLTFVAVPRDSRCPRDVNCIVAGEALVVLEADRGGEKTELTFKIPPGGQDEQTLDELTITITALAPETNSTKKIDPSDYIATILVTAP